MENGNILYYGDNLDILSRYVKDESVDLVYLDPPFNSNANYNVLFKERDGSEAAGQIQAFEDTWTWTSDDEKVYAALVTAGGKVADCLEAFRKFLGPCDMLAYPRPSPYPPPKVVPEPIGFFLLGHFMFKRNCYENCVSYPPFLDQPLCVNPRRFRLALPVAATGRLLLLYALLVCIINQ